MLSPADALKRMYKLPLPHPLMFIWWLPVLLMVVLAQVEPSLTAKLIVPLTVITSKSKMS